MVVALWIVISLLVYSFIGGLLYTPWAWLWKKVDVNDPEFGGTLCAIFWPLAICLGIVVALVFGPVTAGLGLPKFIKKRQQLKPDVAQELMDVFKGEETPEEKWMRENYPGLDQRSYEWQQVLEAVKRTGRRW